MTEPHPGGERDRPEAPAGRAVEMRFLELLHKTPIDTVCPNFYLFDHARGCHFDCSYCFLRDPEYEYKKRRIFSDRAGLLEELRDWIQADNLEAHLANAGNMTDSLTFEAERPLWGELIEVMREYAEKRGRPHCLLAVTKSGSDACGAFFERPPCRNVIVSFSVNAPGAARDHEKGAAAPSERLAAARKLKNLGWRVRVRLDPMIMGYEYADTIEEIGALAPERVTLGTLRADPPLFPVVASLEIFAKLEKPDEGSIWRYPLADRLRLYGQAVKRLEGTTSIGLCEETPEVWKALRLDVDNKTCNCNPL